MLYAVRKRRGQWTVCSDQNVVLQFETYDEAVATARGAVSVLASHSRRHSAASDKPDGHSHCAVAPLLAPCITHGDGDFDEVPRLES
jgi:hypothetical protein